jgi:hypothetical protein
MTTSTTDKNDDEARELGFGHNLEKCESDSIIRIQY